MSTQDQTAQAGEDWVLADEKGQGADTVEAGQGAEQIGAGDVPQLSEIEEVALDLGWTPKDQWRGNPANWVPAKDFVRGTKQVLENARRDVRGARQESQRLYSELDSIRSEVRGVTKQQDAIITQNYNDAMEALEDAKKEAAKAGDDAAYDKLRKQQKDLQDEFAKRPRPQAEPARQSGEMSEHEAYATADEWMKDPIARTILRGQSAWVLQDGGEDGWDVMMRVMADVKERGGNQTDQFAAADAALRQFFPEQYRERRADPAPERQRDPRTGQFTAQDPNQVRRPAPFSQAQRTTPRPAEDAAVRALSADQRAFAEKEIAAGRFKGTLTTWAKLQAGEKVDPLSY